MMIDYGVRQLLGILFLTAFVILAAGSVMQMAPYLDIASNREVVTATTTVPILDQDAGEYSNILVGVTCTYWSDGKGTMGAVINIKESKDCPTPTVTFINLP
jgi:hypothetical protein